MPSLALPETAGPSSTSRPSRRPRPSACSSSGPRRRCPRSGSTPRTPPAVVEICRRLDGIPLALELAAARVNVLSAAEIAQGLGDRFRLLTGGRRTAVPRQQTLQALIDWSWDLLAEADQRLLRRLSVFTGRLDSRRGGGRGRRPGRPGRGDRSAATRLETLDGLGRLVDRSLVVVDHADTTRYGMLETIRQYASDRLVASGEAAALRTRHLARFRRLAVDAAAGHRRPGHGRLAGPRRGRARQPADGAGLGLETDAPAALEMCAALGAYWRSRSLGSEGVDRMREAIEARSPLAHDAIGRAGGRCGRCSRPASWSPRSTWSGYAGWGAVGPIGDETIAVARASGDPAAIADALVAGPADRDDGPRWTAATDELRAAAMEALQLATELDDPVRLSTVQTGLAMIDAREDPAAAEAWLGAGDGGGPAEPVTRRRSRARSRCAAGSRVAPAGTSRPSAGSGRRPTQYRDLSATPGSRCRRQSELASRAAPLGRHRRGRCRVPPDDRGLAAHRQPRRRGQPARVCSPSRQSPGAAAPEGGPGCSARPRPCARRPATR